LSAVSHFVLDVIPHWQEVMPPYTPGIRTAIRAPLDLTVAIWLLRRAMQARPHGRGGIILCALTAAGPDVDAALFVWPDLVAEGSAVYRFWRWHTRIQRETPALWGLLPQFALVAMALVETHQVARRG
jgi:hypothetical protein